MWLGLALWQTCPGPSWSSQDSVDRHSAWLPGSLELLGAQTPKVAMTPGWIVEGIDVVSHVVQSEVSVPVDMLFDPLLFQTSEEGLGNGVVPAVTLSAHARLKMIGTAETQPGVAAVLSPLV